MVTGTAALAALVIGVQLPAVAPAAADDDTPTAPLLMTIDQMTPGYVPDRGGIEIRGTVTNASTEEWRGITVYPFLDVDGVPMTTEGELEAAAASAPDDVVGERITDDPSTRDDIDTLEPGETATYRLTVPRADLPTGIPGVYWFGVHALGESDDTPSDSTADGRARTFLPYVGRTGGEQQEVSVVVPLRHRVLHTGRGSVARPGMWEDLLSEHGNLGRMLAFGQAAVAEPVTWLIDPAVLDAVRQLSRGNPARSLAPTVEPDQGDGSSESPSGSATASETADGDGGDEPKAPSGLPGAADWLSALQDQLRFSDVLALPYGDLDLSAAAEHAPDLYQKARERTSLLDEWRVGADPAIAAPSGYLDAKAFRLADDDSIALVTDKMFPRREFRRGPPPIARVGNHRVAVIASDAGEGGPGPDPRVAPVALRQRILSEAALRLLHNDTGTMVVVLPPTVDPEDADQFWSGLSGAPWVDLTSVSDAMVGPSEQLALGKLSYPDEEADAELDASVFDEAEGLVRDGESLQRMLTLNDTVASQVVGEALTATSYAVRPAPAESLSRLTAGRDWIAEREAGIRLRGPRGVTLSSADGSFAVTLVNRLQQPVTVQLEDRSDEGIQVDVGDPIQIAANSRTTQVIAAHTSEVGVHQVRLRLTDTDGHPLGATTEVTIRSGQVGEIIWVIIGTGVGILFVAIAIRLFRRIRRSRASAPSAPETQEGTT